MVIGNIKSFRGTGLVAFIDILGFSKEIEDNWESDIDNPLKRILNLKRNLPKASNKVYNEYKQEEKKFVYMCRVQTISDSVIVSFGLNSPTTMGEITLGMMAFLDNVVIIWRRAIDMGFTVRGAIDFGNVFWNQSEIIGPAFINSYKMEQNVAKTSRIILSSAFNKNVLNICKQSEEGMPMFGETILKILRKDIDGMIIINPNKLYRSEKEKEYIIGMITDMEIKAKSSVKEKYVPLLAALSSDKYNLTFDDLGRY